VSVDHRRRSRRPLNLATLWQLWQQSFRRGACKEWDPRSSQVAMLSCLALRTAHVRTIRAVSRFVPRVSWRFDEMGGWWIGMGMTGGCFTCVSRVSHVCCVWSWRCQRLCGRPLAPHLHMRLQIIFHHS
jgi:hypothetical protein